MSMQFKVQIPVVKDYINCYEYTCMCVQYAESLHDTTLKCVYNHWNAQRSVVQSHDIDYYTAHNGRA